MNARGLQQAIIDDLEQFFSKNSFKTPHHEMKPLRAYRQHLPQFDAQELDDFFPYIIVRLDKGGIENPTSPHKVDVMLVIGIYDDGTNEYRPNDKTEFIGENGWDTRNLGSIAVMEIIEKIQAHYEQEPSLENGRFYFDGPFHWATQDEDSYPYYFGVCELSFTLAAPRKKESQFV